MGNNLRISVKGFPEDLAVDIANTIAEAILEFKKVDEHLDFRRLYQIAYS